MSDMESLGIGTDIVECVRIGRLIEEHGELFLRRVYTDKEILYCQTRRLAMQHFAGRWAAKEAILKALGTGWRKGISWRDMEVSNDRKGKPVVTMRGGAKDVMKRLGSAEILVSISHTRTYAVAFAIAVAGKSDSDLERETDSDHSE